MRQKNLVILSTLVIFSLLISACSSAVYSSTGWYGLSATSDTAFLAAGGFVYAVDLNTHNQKWKFPSDKANSKGFYANPVLTPDGKQLLVPGYDDNLYSLDPNNNGTELWRFSESKTRLIASPLVIQDLAYQPSTDGNVYAINLTTHNKEWVATTGEPNWAEPAAGPTCGCIYVSSMDGYVYKFSASDGTQMAKSPSLGGAIVGTPAIGLDGTLYVGSFGNQMFALDGNNLTIKWQVPTHDWVWSGPALENDVLYFGDLAGYFYALNAVDGKAKFGELQVNNPVVDTPMVTGDKIYFTAESDTLYIADTSGGLSSKVIGGQIYSGPSQAGNTILVAPSGFSAQLVAVGEDGTQQWVFPPPKS
jgi:outer membrane protein assembly factor BamB